MNETGPHETESSSSDLSKFLIPPDVRWIVFDAVGTLIRPTPSVAIAYQTIGARHGSVATAAETGDRFRRAFEQSENDSFPGGPPVGSPWRTSHEVEIARWQWIVRQVLPDVRDVDKCFDELWHHFSLASSWSCFDDIKISLEALSVAGYQLAIASNFDSRLHSVCDNRQDFDRVDRKFVSSEIGYRKPAVGFFSAVIDACDVPPQQILFIGDDPEHDVAGPQASGLKALLIDRSSAKPAANSIRSLDQLAPH